MPLVTDDGSTHSATVDKHEIMLTCGNYHHAVFITVYRLVYVNYNNVLMYSILRRINKECKIIYLTAMKCAALVMVPTQTCL